MDELNKKLAQEFPSAAQATKSSVDSSIVEAQKTVSSSTGKMKTDAETRTCQNRLFLCIGKYH